MNSVLSYLGRLTIGRTILWCYAIWWSLIVVRYFDPSPAIWLTAAGLSLIIGVALLINTTRSGPVAIRIGFWPTLRLFLIPFCVSSFSMLVKGRGFLLVFSPDWRENMVGLGLCVMFVLLARTAAWVRVAVRRA